MKQHIAFFVLYLLTAGTVGAQNPNALDAADGTPTEAVYVDDNGQVGIGTKTPTADLDLVGHFGLTGHIDGRRPAGTLGIHANGWSQQGAGIELYGNGAQRKGMLALIAGHGDGDPDTAGGINFGNYTGTNWRLNMSIKNTGRVGIGTQNPLDRLQVGRGPSTFGVGSATSQALRYGTSYVGFNAIRGSSGWRFSTDTANNGGAVVYSSIWGDLRFVTVPTDDPSNIQLLSDTEILSNLRMVIKNDGKVGIGISPQAQLHLADIYSAGGRNLQIGNDTYFSDIDEGNVLGLHGRQQKDRGGLRLGEAGPLLFGIAEKLGLGTKTPTSKLHLSGTGTVGLLVEADRDNIGEGDHPQIVLSQDGGIHTGALEYFGHTNNLRLVNNKGGARIVLNGNGDICIGTGC